MNPNAQLFERIGKPTLSRRRIATAYLIFVWLFALVTAGSYRQGSLADGRQISQYGIAFKWLAVTNPPVKFPQSDQRSVDFRPLNFAGSVLLSGTFYTLLFAGWIFRYRVQPTVELQEQTP